MRNCYKIKQQKYLFTLRVIAMFRENTENILVATVILIKTERRQIKEPYDLRRLAQKDRKRFRFNGMRQSCVDVGNNLNGTRLESDVVVTTQTPKIDSYG